MHPCALLKFGLGVGRLHILTTGIIGKLAGLLTHCMAFRCLLHLVYFVHNVVRTSVVRVVAMGLRNHFNILGPYRAFFPRVQ